MARHSGIEFDYELNWTWWTVGARRKALVYSPVEWLIGLGPLLLVIRCHS